MVKRVLKCKQCRQSSQNIQTDPHAWDDWSILPDEICPACQDLAIASRTVQQSKPNRSRVFSTTEYARVP